MGGLGRIGNSMGLNGTAISTSYSSQTVGFLDLLGFRKEIENIDLDCRKLEGTADLLKIFHEEACKTPQRKQYSVYQNRLSAFSDNVVISGDVGFVLRLARWVTLKSIKAGFLVRGGVVNGLLYHSESIVVGSGLVEAYNQEQRYAKYARTVIHRNIVTGGLKRELSDLLKKDRDGAYFLDVLSSLGLQQEDHINLLEEVRKSLLIISRKIDRNDESFQKLAWFVSYFNDAGELAYRQRKERFIPLEIDDKKTST